MACTSTHLPYFFSFSALSLAKDGAVMQVELLCFCLINAARYLCLEERSLPKLRLDCLNLNHTGSSFTNVVQVG